VLGAGIEPAHNAVLH